MFAYYSDYLQIGRSLAAIISAPRRGRIRLQFDECLARVGPVTSQPGQSCRGWRQLCDEEIET